MREIFTNNYREIVLILLICYIIFNSCNYKVTKISNETAKVNNEIQLMRKLAREPSLVKKTLLSCGFILSPEITKINVDTTLEKIYVHGFSTFNSIIAIESIEIDSVENGVERNYRIFSFNKGCEVNSAIIVSFRYNQDSAIFNGVRLEGDLFKPDNSWLRAFKMYN